MCVGVVASVTLRSPLQDHTNFSESTPKGSNSVDLLEMDWGEVPDISPIKNGSWSPEPTSDTPAATQEPHKYYIAPTIRYDNPKRPQGKRLKKEKKNKQVNVPDVFFVCLLLSSSIDKTVRSKVKLIFGGKLTLGYSSL